MNASSPALCKDKKKKCILIFVYLFKEEFCFSTTLYVMLKYYKTQKIHQWTTETRSYLEPQITTTVETVHCAGLILP